MYERLFAELDSEDDRIRQQAIDEARRLSAFDLALLIEQYFAPRAKPEAQTQMRRWYILAVLGRRAELKTEDDSALTIHRRAQESLAQIVGLVPDATYVGPVLTCLARRSRTGADYKISAACQEALNRLMPEIKPEHAAHWADAQRKQLLHSLKIVYLNYPETDTLRAQIDRSSLPYLSMPRFGIGFNLRHVREQALAVLKLLQQIGDERELKLVRYIANIKPRTPIAGEIQRAAEECLPFIELRVHENRQAKTLLRSSDSCAAAPDALLRPAAECAETDSHELLRPESGLESR